MSLGKLITRIESFELPRTSILMIKIIIVMPNFFIEKEYYHLLSKVCIFLIDKQFALLQGFLNILIYQLIINQLHKIKL